MSWNDHNAMPKLTVVSLLRAILMAAMLFATPATFALDAGDLVIISAKGEVQVTMTGAIRNARAGMVLELPASVRTGRDGGLELRQGATTVSVGPETLLEFPALERRGAPIDRIQQPRGNAFYDIGKREGRKLRVETPYLVAVVKGTQFNVAAQDESTTISLFEGLLEIRASDDSAVVDIKAGEIASRKRGDNTINVIRMDAGKTPTTAPPLVQSDNTQSGDAASGVTNAAPPGATERPRAHGPVVNVDGSVQVPAGSAGVGLSAEIRSPVAGVSAETTAEVGSGIATVNVNAAAGAVDASTNVSVSAGASGADASVNVAAGVGSVVDTSTSVAVDVARGGASVDVSTSTNVDAGPVSAGVDTGAAMNLGSAGAAVDVATSTTVDAGPVTVDVETSTSVDLTDGGVAANVDAGAALGVAQTPVDVAAGVNVGADLSTGAVDLGVSVSGVDLVDVTLGLGEDPTTDTGSPTTDTATDSGDTGTVDVGGLLDGLLRRPGRR